LQPRELCAVAPRLATLPASRYARAATNRIAPHGAVAVAIFALTIVGVVSRPRGISEAVCCVAGALAMLVFGVLSLADAWRSIAVQWDVLLFLTGLLLVSWTAERAGVFRWTALRTALAARGSGTTLFFYVCGLAVVLTTFFSLDATALLLTAVLAPLTLELGLPPAPYAFACAFIANSASLTLPVSNPLNILVLGTSSVPLGAYVVHLLPASFAIVALTIAFLWLRFRGMMDRRFDPRRLVVASDGTSNRPFFLCAASVMVLLAAGYVVAALVGAPLSLPVALAGGVLLIAALTFGRAPVRELRGAPWAILPFVVGLLVAVRGLETTGLTGELGRWLLERSRQGPLYGVLASAAVAATGSNAINNLPMGAVMLSALREAGARGEAALLYGTLLGADVGPNLTVLGALSSMLWLLQLRRAGIAIGARDFFREGVLLTPLLLAAGVIAVALLA
jgi:arsenical pump membrane protein